MDAEEEIECAAWRQQVYGREGRRERRYGKLLADALPDWTVYALRRELIDNLGATANARLAARSGFYQPTKLHSDCTDPVCVHCQPGTHYLSSFAEERSRLIRLANYPDMRGAWEAVRRRKRSGRLSRLAGAQRMDSDAICWMLIGEINRTVRSFQFLPTRTEAQKKKGAGKVARLARELAEAIDADEDGRGLARRFLAQHIGMRHIKLRVELGEIPKTWMVACPELSFQQPQGYFEGDDETDQVWDKWPTSEQFRWLSDEVNAISVQQVLSSFADTVLADAESTSVISRPNSGNPHVRYLATELSKFMVGWFDSPLDDAVACFVSAALDLPEPLTRDDIKQLRKRSMGT